MNETRTAQTPTTGTGMTAQFYRPKLSFYHPNAKGTGAAMELELHPAHDDTDGSVWVRMANQLTIGDRNGPTPVYPRFDWENALTIKLDFNDLTKMLQVFRGECETIEDGMGLCHLSPRGSTKIMLRHLVEPKPGYMFEVYRNARGAEDSNARIFLFTNEALGLAAALESSMGVICFGIPMVIPRNTTAYRNATREMRNAPAA